MLHLFVYILPEHIWKDIYEKEVKSFKNEPTDGASSGPGPSSSSSARRASSSGSRRTPATTAGKPHVDELMFRIFKNERRPGPGPAQGRDRLRRRAGGERVRRAQGRRRHHRGPPPTRASTRSPSTSARPWTTGPRSVTGNPALKDKRVRQAIYYAIDRQALVDRVAVYGTPGSTIIPPMYEDLHLRARRTQFAYTRPAAGRAARRGRLPLGADGMRVGPERQDADLPAVRPPGVRRPPSRPCSSSRAGCEERRHRRSRPRSSPRTRSSSSSGRATSTCSSGAGSWSPTPTTSSRPSPARSAPPRTAAPSTRTCPTRSSATRSTTASTRSRRCETDPASARRHRQGDAADRLRRGAVRRHLLLRPAPGLPLGPVHQLRPQPKRLRLPAVPVRHVVLPVDHPGDGRGRGGHGLHDGQSGSARRCSPGSGRWSWPGSRAVVLVARRRSSDEDTE